MTKILISIVTIDEDQMYFDFLNHNLRDSLSGHFNYDVLVVCREKDSLTQAKWKHFGATVCTVPNYDIAKRHNTDQVGLKRNLCLSYADERGYDAVFFIDADVLINTKIALQVKALSCGNDIVLVPYEHILTKESTIGIFSGDNQIVYVKHDAIAPQDRILGGGAGCTLISKRCFGIKFQNLDSGKYYGEDIGFFINCLPCGIKIAATKSSALHIYEKNRNRPLSNEGSL